MEEQIDKVETELQLDESKTVSAEQTDVQESNESEMISLGNCTVREEDQAPIQAPRFDLEKIRDTLTAQYERVIKWIKNEKSKDANIALLTKALDQYRNGVESTLFKSMARSLILFRENARSSYRSLEGHTLTKEDAIKYLQYTIDEYEGMMEDIGLTQSDGEYLFYDCPIKNEGITHVEFRDIAPFEPLLVAPRAITNEEEFLGYLQECEDAMQKNLANSVAMDTILADYIRAAGYYDQAVFRILQQPLLMNVIRYHQEMVQLVRGWQETLTEENAAQIYLLSLEKSMEYAAALMEVCGIVIDEFVSDLFDRTKQTIMKTIPTDDIALDKTIAVRRTACYSLADKIIYPQKVEVYKYNK